MSEKHINERAYKMGAAKKVYVLVEIALDPVPGFGHNVEDHISVIFRNNPYVQTAEVQEFTTARFGNPQQDVESE